MLGWMSFSEVTAHRTGRFICCSPRCNLCRDNSGKHPQPFRSAFISLLYPHCLHCKCELCRAVFKIPLWSSCFGWRDSHFQWISFPHKAAFILQKKLFPHGEISDTLNCSKFNSLKFTGWKSQWLPAVSTRPQQSVTTGISSLGTPLPGFQAAAPVLLNNVPLVHRL